MAMARRIRLIVAIRKILTTAMNKIGLALLQATLLKLVSG